MDGVAQELAKEYETVTFDVRERRDFKERRAHANVQELLALSLRYGVEVMPTAEDAAVKERMTRALESDVPNIYFNGFANGISTGDIIMALEKNSAPVGVINMSFSVAKTLSVSLGTIIASIEEASGQPIMTTHELQAFMEKDAEKPKTKTRKKSKRA